MRVSARTTLRFMKAEVSGKATVGSAEALSQKSALEGKGEGEDKGEDKGDGEGWC